MKRKNLFWSLIPILLLILAALVLTSRKTVVLEVDGESQHLTTYALTVGQLLNSAGVPLASGDRLDPPLESWLKNGQVVSLDRAVPVVILADGQYSVLVTPERLPANLLALSSVAFHPGDELIADGHPASLQDLLKPDVSHHLFVIRSVAITLQEDGEIKSMTSTAPSLGQALWEAGVVVRVADQLTPPFETSLAIPGAIQPSMGLKVSLVRSRPITIRLAGKQIEARTVASRVGEALAELGLAPQGLDYSLPAVDAPLPADGDIRLVRVREDLIIEQTPLPFEVEFQPVPDLEIDNQNIVRTGEYGLTARRVRVRYEDGQETARIVENQWVARSPLNRIVGYGTLIIKRTLKTPNGSIDYWRALRMWATAYSPTGGGGGTTAIGLPVKKGVCAVDIRYIPFYTWMYVPGYGKVMAADVGGGVIGRWIDLAYSDEDLEAWHQWVTVYFLWPPPENPVWIIP